MSGHRHTMTRAEFRAATALAAMVALRLFGLFLILPVFAAFAPDLAGATPLLIGMALGAYGLTQGLLQIPMGWLSDRFGRRPVIAWGLLVFVAGSVLAAVSSHIWGVVAGRALQGCGAIAGAAMAWAADSSRDSQRSKVMALVGTGVGAAFALAMVAGPVLGGWFGLSGLFWLSAVLGAGALGLLFTLVPDGGEPRVRARGDWRLGPAPGAVADLCLNVFLLHGLLTALFVVLPTSLAVDSGLAVTRHWMLYLPALALAGGISLGVVFAGRERAAPYRVAPGVLAMTAAVAGLGYGPGGVVWALPGLAVFFTGFTLLEATLPAMMSYSVSAARRGTAMGLYASCQFLGAFAGGLAAGAVLGVSAPAAVFGLIVLAGVVWLVYALLRTPAWGRMRTH